ncbi:hypothetical protein K435DRAFT_847305 [Dendrothele bispora CBS 962.96]|uniref:Uncharacterized protein n=1 Tax=Dendrothele bispora (strain CBS 962.96) TaxID=1314807 RepID=A0A4S8N0P8_DENBC|nr:hypothetical protein K435DRAFT_847305 [Dendrothele bispora CBS 962.96]
MDYVPRYVQPFSLAEAIALDVSTISEEIARLQNSLKHLNETQQFLKEIIEAENPETVDADLTKAYEENQTVIGSQEERISMLKLALTEKGVTTGTHYEPVQTQGSLNGIQQDPLSDLTEAEEDDSEGIHL